MARPQRRSKTVALAYKRSPNKPRDTNYSRTDKYTDTTVKNSGKLKVHTKPDTTCNPSTRGIGHMDHPCRDPTNSLVKEKKIPAIVKIPHKTSEHSNDEEHTASSCDKSAPDESPKKHSKRDPTNSCIGSKEDPRKPSDGREIAPVKDLIGEGGYGTLKTIAVDAKDSNKSHDESKVNG